MKNICPDPTFPQASQRRHEQVPLHDRAPPCRSVLDPDCPLLPRDECSITIVPAP